MAELQVFKGMVEVTNDGGFKFKDSAAWVNYSKVGQGYVGPTFQQGEQAVVRCSESKGKWYASFGEYPNGGGQQAAPAPSPAPSPAPAASPAPQDPGPQPDSYDGFRATNGSPEPEPGTHAYRDVSINRQNCRNVAVQALIANLENCEPDQKPSRMVTPFAINEFVEYLQGREEGPEPESEAVTESA